MHRVDDEAAVGEGRRAENDECIQEIDMGPGKSSRGDMRGNTCYGS